MYLARVAIRQDFPTETIAKRVRELRRRHDLTAEQLADKMRDVGVPFDKTVIANLETGRRRFVTVQELFALAFVFGVAPVHLMVPTVDPDDRTPYPVVPNSPVIGPEPYPAVVRAWIRGQLPITPDVKTYFSEVPASEWTAPGPSDKPSFPWATRPTWRPEDDDGER